MPIPFLLARFNEARKKDKGPVVTLLYPYAEFASRAEKLIDHEIDVNQRGINPRIDTTLNHYDAGPLVLEVPFTPKRRNRAKKIYDALTDMAQGCVISFGQTSFRIRARADTVLHKLFPAAEAAGLIPLIHKGETAFADKNPVSYNHMDSGVVLRFRNDHGWENGGGHLLGGLMQKLDEQHLVPTGLDVRGLGPYLTGGAALEFNDRAAMHHGQQRIAAFAGLRANAHVFAIERDAEHHRLVLRGPEDFLDTAKDVFRHDPGIKITGLSLKTRLDL